MFIKASILKNIIYSVARTEDEIAEILNSSRLPAGIIEDADIEIDWEQAQHLWKVVEEFSNDKNIGLKVGAKTSVNATGLVGMLAQSSPTVEKAWDEISKFYSLFTDMMTYQSEREGFTYTITFKPALQWKELYSETARHAVSQTALATLKIFSALCRKRLIPKKVGFSFEKPEGHEEYSQLFGQLIQYGEKTTYIVFDEKVANYKIVSYASEVYLGLKQLCQGQLKDRLSKDMSIKSQVGKLIIEELDKGGASLNEIAASLGVGERTLQRKLAKEGVKFKTYYNEIRMTLAKKMLENSKYNVSEIAAQLGYIELSSFRKMFVQTYGLNPKQFQINQATDQSKQSL